MKKAIRSIALFIVITLGVAALIWGCAAAAARGRISTAPAKYDATLTAEAKKLRNFKDVEALMNGPVDKLPTPYRDGPVKPQHESPLLDELVKKGELPPLKDRMPEDPVVMEGCDPKEPIGKYGGTWLRMATAESDIPATIGWRMAGTFLCRWSPLGYPIKPFIAKSITHSDDMTTWTITLRKGMRWSNGDPYSADDIMFWWNDEVQNKVLNGLKDDQEPNWPKWVPDEARVAIRRLLGIHQEPHWPGWLPAGFRTVIRRSMGVEQVPNWPDWLLVQGMPPVIEKINDFAIRVKFVAPYALFEEQLCTHQGGNMVGAPSKFLRPYHPDPAIGDAKIIARDMAGFKQPSAQALYSFIRDYQNTKAPSLGPWIYRTFSAEPPQVFVRNPYFFAVDPDGNQLPYIDRVQVDIKENGEIMTVAVANGDASMQDRGVDFTGYTEFMSRRQASHTKVLHWYPATRQVWLINVNSNRHIDPADPSTEKRAKLLSDKKFRQAMSIAINRPEIIQAEYFGLGEPSQVAPGAGSVFDNPELDKKYTDYDPAKANKYLDELGLTKRDYEGYRTFPDGSRMTFFIDYCEFTHEGPCQFVIDDWKAVGVRCEPRSLMRSLYDVYAQSGDFDFDVFQSESEIVPLLEPTYFALRDGSFAAAWGRWYKLGGMWGNPAATAQGVDPRTSANGQAMYQIVQLYEKALRATNRADQIKTFREMQAIDAENVWTIGIATSPPDLAIISDDLKNVPDRAIYGPTFSNPSDTGVETYYFDHPQKNPSADAALMDSIVHPTNRPGAADTVAPKGHWISLTIEYTCLAIFLAGCVMVAVRHPFALRRFLILGPMLLVISIAVFSIIQLPPGDFISNKREQLMEVRDPNMNQELENLRIQFHTDQPKWVNYFRWVGLKWFTSFQPGDEGLLEGNLGRSMESGLPVNDQVGDRIILTVLLSLGSILFTWALALPIGIYSAVRQYSITDYILTFLGFIGMSVPGFSLALVLMAGSGFTGLYSPQYAAQPAWSFAKFIDLSEHLWIPIVVLAVGGTAGMIRVMRANLLDELRRPYVTTARAKGVRPIKLLIKYPVRIALNPFVSSIGGLFPGLISGGAIVSIVLAIPLVGPLLLTSLMSQDVYLAASMLMVLSLLGVLGTLISDLLLLWLDPRIRFEGGSR